MDRNVYGSAGTGQILIHVLALWFSTNHRVLPTGKAPNRQNTIALQEEFPYQNSCADGEIKQFWERKLIIYGLPY